MSKCCGQTRNYMIFLPCISTILFWHWVSLIRFLSLFIGRMKGRPGWAVTPQVMSLNLYAFSLEKEDLLPLGESFLSPSPKFLHSAKSLQMFFVLDHSAVMILQLHSRERPSDWFSIWKPQTYLWRHCWCFLISLLAIYYCILSSSIASVVTFLIMIPRSIALVLTSLQFQADIE